MLNTVGWHLVGLKYTFKHLLLIYLKIFFSVDYYYCDSTPYIGSDWVHPDTDPFREKYLRKNNVNLIKFDVEAKISQRKLIHG